MGTETPVPLSPRNPQVLLEIKGPLVGTETIYSVVFSSMSEPLGIKRPLVGTETNATSSVCLFASTIRN